MKSTGIVRRIDELGRVVIPKEIRKTLRIKEGEPLEIFTEKDQLFLKKYSPVASLENFAELVTESLYTVNECTAILCDNEKIVSVKGSGSKELCGKLISEEVANLIEERKSYVGGNSVAIAQDGDGQFASVVIVPILAGGDVFGAIILGNPTKENAFGNSEIKSVRAFCEYIGRYLN